MSEEPQIVVLGAGLGEAEPFYEKLALHVLGIKKLHFN